MIAGEFRSVRRKVGEVGRCERIVHRRQELVGDDLLFDFSQFGIGKNEFLFIKLHADLFGVGGVERDCVLNLRLLKPQPAQNEQDQM